MTPKRIAVCLGAALVLALSAVVSGEAPAPPGVEPQLLRRHQGEAARRAARSLDEVLKSIERPDYLPALGEKPGGDAADRIVQQRRQRAAELQAALKKNPNDAAAIDELVRIAVVELDEPALAAPFVARSTDAKARLHVPLAARPPAHLADFELLDVAVWYRELSAGQHRAAQAKLLRRAERYLKAFLDKHKDDDLSRTTAQVSLRQVQAQLAELGPDDGGAGARREPPRAVQRAYAWARAEWQAGDPFRAVNRLEAANNITPNQPDIVRLLGIIHYFGTRNHVQAAQYLQQAVRLNPTDVEVLYLLGRYEAVHLRQWNRAISVLAHLLTLEPAETDPAVETLARHYLARALQNEGCDAAAAEQFETVLTEPLGVGRTSRHLGELALFARNQPISWQQLGDAQMRLGRPGKARRAYELGLAAKPTDATQLAARLAYTQLLLNNPDAAADTVIAAVRDSSGSDDALKLLAWLTTAGADADALSQRIAKVYRQMNQPAALALAIATMQPRDAAEKTLTDHLAARPADRDVLARLLASLLPAQGDRRAAAAVHVTAAAIAAQPDAVERYSDLLLSAAGNAADLADAFDMLPKDEQDKPVVLLLRAMVLSAANRAEEALAFYDRAFKADPKLTVAQARYVEMLIERRDYEAAAKALDALGNTDDARLTLLRIKVLRQTGKMAEALALVERLMDAGRPSPQLIIEKAALQAAAGNIGAAVDTFEKGIEANPLAEALYEEMMDLLETHRPPDAAGTFRQLVERAVRHIPNSKFVRLFRAEQLIAAGQLNAAERVVRTVLADQPNDARAIGVLAEILSRTDRTAEADRLVEQALDKAPDDTDVLRMAHMHYLRTENGPKRYEVLQKLIPKLFDGVDRTRQMVALHVQFDEPGRAVDYIMEQVRAKQPLDADGVRITLTLLGQALTRAGRDKDADKLFDDALKAWPDHWAEGAFAFAMYMERIGNKPRSEDLLGQIIKKEPKHAAANNALGYSWVDQGKNIERARKMIQIALDAEPDNSAYLDSMGWVHYKLRQYDEAVKWLERSRVQDGGDHPVILDHLGDALYRAGRQVEALEWWGRAQVNLAEYDAEDDAELQNLAGKLRAKVTAVRTAKEPPLAEAPGSPEPQKPDQDDPKQPAQEPDK